jgi:RNA recognition motif-containing protein
MKIAWCSLKMSCELFIGNLNPDIRIRDLENVYGRYGKILRCDLKKNYGFIQYSDRRDAEQALQKENNRELLGSVMTVEWAKGSIGDRPRGGGGGRGPRNRSPPRGGRDRSPLGGGRARSPPRFSRGFDREERFGGGGGGFGGGRRSGGGRDYDNPRMDRGPPRDRARGGDRFNGSDGYGGPPGRGGDRGDRRPPLRDNRGYDRPRGGDKFNRRDSFGSERKSFGGGPRRF